MVKCCLARGKAFTFGNIASSHTPATSSLICWANSLVKAFVARYQLARMMNWFSTIFAAALIALCARSLNAAESVTNRFGFKGKEIFPIDYQITQLHAADLDGDGLPDLI